MRPVTYNVLGHPITAAMRLETVDRLIATHEAMKARVARTSPYGIREWEERQDRYLAERAELLHRLSAPA